MFFILVPIFMYLQILRFADLEYHLKEQLKEFYFGPAYHETSDHQIDGFEVALRAAEWVFILVLISCCCVLYPYPASSMPYQI